MSLDWTSTRSVSTLSNNTPLSGARAERLVFDGEVRSDGDVEVREAFPSKPELEDAYQRIGRWRGHEATLDARNAVHSFWAGLGDVGARWLVDRIAAETNIDALDGVAGLLASLRVVALAPLVEALGKNLAPDQELALLQALGSMSPPPSPEWTWRIERALRERVCAHDADLAETASRATRALTRDRAIALLEKAESAARTPELRATIAHEIAERRA